MTCYPLHLLSQEQEEESFLSKVGGLNLFHRLTNFEYCEFLVVYLFLRLSNMFDLCVSKQRLHSARNNRSIKEVRCT
jgi:hypothetical protein